MEYILETSFVSVKQAQLSSDDTRTKYYFVITGQEEALQFKIVHETLLKDLSDVKFKKLYCISSEEHLKLDKLVTLVSDADVNSKMLAHPSVKVVKKQPQVLYAPEKVEEKVISPFDQIKEKRKKKNDLTKESFFSSFKKVEKATESLQTTHDTAPTVDVKEKVTQNKVKKEKKEKKIVAQIVSDKSLKQEADLMDMFDKEEKVEEKVHGNQDQGNQEQGKIGKIRKKRKVVKTMTFMEGKYMKTRDVEAWESYSEEENEKTLDGFNELKKKRKGGQQQYSISSFFKK